MTYKLFIDDLRDPIGNDWVIARSSAEARRVVFSRGFPYFISFDHDLGGDDTAIPFVRWMIDHSLDNPDIIFPADFYVHSANPVGAENIRGLMNSYIAYLNKKAS